MAFSGRRFSTARHCERVTNPALWQTFTRRGCRGIPDREDQCDRCLTQHRISQDSSRSLPSPLSTHTRCNLIPLPNPECLRRFSNNPDVVGFPCVTGCSAPPSRAPGSCVTLRGKRNGRHLCPVARSRRRRQRYGSNWLARICPPTVVPDRALGTGSSGELPAKPQKYSLPNSPSTSMIYGSALHLTPCSLVIAWCLHDDCHNRGDFKPHLNSFRQSQPATRQIILLRNDIVTKRVIIQLRRARRGNPDS